MKVSEAAFATTIEQLLDMFGWRWMHSRPAKTDRGWRTALSGTEGFPDYLAVRGDRLLVAELKSDDGELSIEQYFWLKEMAEAGIDAYLWQPSDNFDQIVGILK